ncbi:hypothetical protein HDE_10751 [Halotydeus destructor]|nr:hypothetical protein HDE_10751 [Halotydeus destructor]
MADKKQLWCLVLCLATAVTITPTEAQFVKVSSTVEEVSLPAANGGRDSSSPQSSNIRVSGSCVTGGKMVLRIEGGPYALAYARGFAGRPGCSWPSNNSTANSVTVNLLAGEADSDYCGVLRSRERKDEKSVQLVVRLKAAIELQADRLFLVTCSNLPSGGGGGGAGGAGGSGRQGRLLNGDPESVDTLLTVLRGDQPVRSGRLVAGQSYRVLDGAAGGGGPLVDCVLFGPASSGQQPMVRLTDGRGCAVDERIATATGNQSLELKQAFRFLDDSKQDGSDEGWSGGGSQLQTLQCSRLSCAGDQQCPQACSSPSSTGPTGGTKGDLVSVSWRLVRDPEPDEECERAMLRRDWLAGLSCVLAALLLVMLCLNCFLCSSLSCSCTRHRQDDTSADDDDHVITGYDHEAGDFEGIDYDLDSSLGTQQQHPNKLQVIDYDPYHQHHSNSSTKGATRY